MLNLIVVIGVRPNDMEGSDAIYANRIYRQFEIEAKKTLLDINME